jgi:hypothetical protein
MMTSPDVDDLGSTARTTTAGAVAVADVGVSGYPGVLRLPGALAFSGSAAISRLAQAMLSLGSVLLLT